MTKKQGMILAASVAVLALGFLLLGCGTAVSNEVKTDSTHADTTLVDTLKVDSIGKK
jgi:hypothetical protein